MTIIDVFQRWSLEVLGLFLIIIPGILLLQKTVTGNVQDWLVYVILIAFGGLLSGFKAIWHNVMRYQGK